MADIKLCHDKQKLRPPELIFFQTYIPNYMEIRVDGAKTLFNELLRGNSRDFARFRSTGFIKVRNEIVAPSEAEAIELARNYLAACAHPKGRELDPECNYIGGHTHIVSVKRGGFKWVDPPA